MRGCGHAVGLAAALVLTAGCAQVDDGRFDDAAVDAPHDLPADSAMDAMPDTGDDPGADSLPVDVVDTAWDPAADTVADSIADTGWDSATDTAMDGVDDTATDGVDDTGVDSATDTAVDTGTDVSPDATGCAAAVATFDYTFDGAGDCAAWTHSPWSGSGCGPYDSWECGSISGWPSNPSGSTGSLGTDLDGWPSNDECSTVASPSVDLTACAGQTVYLDFRVAYSIEDSSGGCRDGGFVAVHDGSTWVLADGSYDHACAGCHHLGGETAWCGYEVDWHDVSVDVSAHMHSAFRVRFVIEYDDGYPWSGLFVDDVRLRLGP